MHKRTLKQFALITIIISFVSSALAVAPGFYVGLMFGSAANNAKPQNVQLKRPDSIKNPHPPPPRIFLQPITLTLAKPRNNNQWGTRLFIGYKMNPYAGFESGFTFFTSINYNIADPNPALEACSTPSIHIGAWDVLGRLSLPFGDWFEAYVKGGGAVTYVRVSGAFFPNSENECGGTQSNTKVRPVLALGANASLSQNWVIDVSYTRYFIGSTVNYIDFFAVGASYHFVDKFCGQFLCDD